MKKTKTRNLEEFIVSLYLKSRKEDFIVKGAITARAIIKKFLEYIDAIDEFCGTSHLEIVKKIYFGNANILKSGIELISLNVFVPVRTLLAFRQKYGVIIEKVLIVLDNKSQ